MACSLPLCEDHVSGRFATGTALAAAGAIMDERLMPYS